ncbi:MAG: hypothetical protein KGJ62_03185 [Armatimonadetes bacterium]|nr:hypothetical protein [Armatimonadota bacterium]MDE2207202.1 hypothetical protein [Armatimonadota bacterium]
MNLSRYCVLAFSAVLATAWAATPPAAAQTAFPMIWSANPVGVARGATQLVTVDAGGSEGGGGVNLWGAYTVLFNDPGVTATIVPPAGGWPKPPAAHPDQLPVVSSIQMRVTAAKSAWPGMHEFRIGTPHNGISTVGVLIIGDLPDVLSLPTNQDAAHPQRIPVPCAVDGVLSPAESTHHFVFHAEAGQELVFHVECAELEDKIHDLNVHADPLLQLHNAAGDEIAENDDYYGADSLLAWHCAAAGDYTLWLRDVSFGGNPHWPYRLTVSDGPYVTAMDPCAAPPGAATQIHVWGYNLGQQPATATVTIPNDAPPGVTHVALQVGGAVTNVIPLLVSRAPQVAVMPAPEPAGSVVTAGFNAAEPAPRQFAVPGAVNAVLTENDEIDSWRFHAVKGEALGFEVTSHRLDSPMDPEMKIRNVKGAVLAENDDTFGKDPRIDWTAPADGEYTVQVRDISGHSGPAYFYNLTAAALTPDFSLTAQPGRAMIAPGNRTAWFVKIARKYGFAGPVTINVTGLPAGVTVNPLTIPPGVDEGELLLSATASSKPATSLVTITGAASLGAPTQRVVTRTATPLEEIYMPGGGLGEMPVDTEGVSVTDAGDVTVSAEPSAISLKPGGTARINVTIVRAQGFIKPVSLRLGISHSGAVYADPLPPGVVVDPGASKLLINPNETTGTITLRAGANAMPVQNLPISVLATVSINFVMRVWYCSPLITVTVQK